VIEKYEMTQIFILSEFRNILPDTNRIFYISNAK